MDMKKYDDAEKLFSEIITDLEKKETDSERNFWLSKAYNNLGFILYKKVEFDLAQSFYKKSMQINPVFAPAYYNHGVINYRLGLFESAIKDLRKAVQLDPENAEFATGLRASEAGLLQKSDSAT